MRTNARLSSEERADARQALGILDGTMSLSDAARIALGRSGGAHDRVSVQIAVERYLEDCRRRCRNSQMRPRTLEFYETELYAFTGDFSCRVDQITKADLQNYLSGLTTAPASKAVRWRAIRAMLNWCERQDPPLLRDNPARLVRLETGAKSEIQFLSVAECESILAVEGPHRHAIALQLFAGLRPEEIAGREKDRLQWDNVNREERLIRVPGPVAKTGTSRILDSLPDTIWLWMADAPETGPCYPMSSAWLTTIAKRKIARKWPQDAMRHTFATYHVAAFGDAGKTALLMGHQTSSMLYRHYRGLATKVEAERFWQLKPQ
jgi:integrase